MTIEDRVAALEGTLGTLVANLLEPALIGPYLTFGDGGVVQMNNTGMQIKPGNVLTTGIRFVPELTSSPDDTIAQAKFVTLIPDTTRAVATWQAQSSDSIYGNVNIDAQSASVEGYWQAVHGSNGAAFGVYAEATGALCSVDAALQLLADDADPTALLADGQIWYRTDTDKARLRANGATVNLATEGYVDALAGPSWGAGTELTIATGAITVTDRWHQVDTEGDAGSDDLVTISGGTTGQPLVLTAINDARTVVVKHGTGNIYLDGGADFSLDHSRDSITLLYNGSAWIEISKADNA